MAEQKQDAGTKAPEVKKDDFKHFIRVILIFLINNEGFEIGLKLAHY